MVRKQRRKEKVKEEKEWKGVYLEREQVSGKWVDILVINKAEQEMEQQQEQQGAEEGEEEEGSVEPYPANVLTARLRVKVLSLSRSLSLSLILKFIASTYVISPDAFCVCPTMKV